MNKILFNFLLSGFFKTFLKVVLIFYCFGIILNLFEEIEFFKNLDASPLLPLTLTAVYIPSMIIKLLPFIVFISSMWFLLALRNNKNLLSLKIFGYSNFRIFFILASCAFIIGWVTLFAFNPLTSTMVKYYEKTKSEYSRDIDHLVSINKNGLWIKENFESGTRITYAREPEKNILKDVTIYNLDQDNNLIRKIYSPFANIEKNKWEMQNSAVFSFTNGITEKKLYENYSIVSDYDYQKINSLFKNFDTMSFLDLLLNYKDLQARGYNKIHLDQNLNSMLSLPFFLFIMTAVAAILSMNTLKKSNNFAFIVAGLITCVLIYYFNNISLALGQTDRVPLSLAAWIPVVVIGLFSSIGIIQINEK